MGASPPSSLSLVGGLGSPARRGSFGSHHLQDEFFKLTSLYKFLDLSSQFNAFGRDASVILVKITIFVPVALGWVNLHRYWFGELVSMET